MPPKRKRAPTITLDPAQPQSHDAADDEAAEQLLEEANMKKDTFTKTESKPTPSKRTRSQVEKEDEVEDNEPNGNGTGEGGEGGPNGTMRMSPPPKAGTVDPIGFKTNPPPEGRPVRIYADGVFDLFHLGHMRVLQQAKTAFPDVHLMVGVTGDKETHRRKGLTVLSAKERAESVRHCRWVDEVIEDCPWIVTVDFLEKHKIDYVAHDDLPYGADEGDDIYTPLKRKGMFLVTQRTEGVSTTGIITKIVRDYEQYIARQLKRGTTRQELNISWMKKNEMEIKRHVNEIRDNIRNNWVTAGQEVGKEFRQFWQPSRPGSPAAHTMPESSRRGRKTDSTLLSSPTLGNDRSAQSPGGWSRLTTGPGGRGDNRDFVAGYAMGLIGSVRGWMQGTRRNLNSRPNSPPSGSDQEDGEKSGPEDTVRGRKKMRMDDKADVIDPEAAV